jgi:hypothetical protein
MFISLYILYALLQAILTARFVLKCTTADAPVFMVIAMMIFAPFLSIGLLITGFGFGINWLVTYRSSK